MGIFALGREMNTFTTPGVNVNVDNDDYASHMSHANLRVTQTHSVSSAGAATDESRTLSPRGERQHRSVFQQDADQNES